MRCMCSRLLDILIDVDDGRSENPFNYDLNDLDLDGFCLMLQRDLHQITAVSLFTGPKPSFLVVTPPRSTLVRLFPTVTSSQLHHLESAICPC